MPPPTQPNDRVARVCNYLNRGWAPLPVPYKSKSPKMPDWPNFRLAHSDVAALFEDQVNVGILLGDPSGGLVDVDLDCPEARELADTFLPNTGAIFERRSNPASHRLYVVGTSETAQFKAPGGKMIVELRSTGTQTLAPPSTHPSGELIRWVENGDPGRPDSEILLAAVRKIAAGALIVQNWPAEGGRHDFALALVGALLSSMMADDVIEFVEAVAEAAGDDEAEDRGRASVATTL